MLESSLTSVEGSHGEAVLAPPVISFGTGLRFVSEDVVRRNFLPGRLTKRGVRAFLRALGVPTLVFDHVRYVESLTLMIALRAALSLGRKDFLVPGPASCKRNSDKERLRFADHLSPEEIKRDLPRLYAELALSASLNGVQLGKKTALMIREIGRDMTLEAIKRQAERLRAGMLHNVPPSTVAALSPTTLPDDEPLPSSSLLDYQGV